ncbi:MAG: glycoside hydrolase family protein [Anaerolineae bacterium]|nr:glycoside hydrolase family protein [Anaerolineae bacterium]
MRTPIIERLQPIPRDSGFRMAGYFIWCASVIRVDGRYHMFASRWPGSTGDPADFHGILAGYRTHSEVVRATADNPVGPYTFEQVVLDRRGPGHWDGTSCHGPKIVKVGDRYVLYYQGIACESPLRKIGYAWADAITGPWHRVDAPLPLTDDANNPAPYVHADGSILMAYRDRELHVYVARAEAYDGHYETVAHDIYPAARLEDPDIFVLDGQYHMVMEDNAGHLTGDERHGGHLVSDDGLHWVPYDPPKVYTHTLEWNDGTSTLATRRERPELFNDHDGVKGNGEPTHLITGVLVDGHSWSVVQEIAPPDRQAED